MYYCDWNQWFFFAFIEHIHFKFPKVFEKSKGGNGGDDATNRELFEKYRWGSVLFGLSNYDLLKVEKVGNKPLFEVLAMLNFTNERNHLLRLDQEIQNALNKKR